MAARFCPQCGQEVPTTARFCANCAAPLNPVKSATLPPIGATSPPTRAVTNMDVAANTTRRLLLPALLAALLVLAIAVAVLAGKYHQSLLAAQSHPSAPASPLLNAPSGPGPAAPPLINAPSGSAPAAPALTNAPSVAARPAPALTNAPSARPPSLPADIDAYLKFLQQIEQRRVALANDASGATSMLDTARQMQADQQDPEQHNSSVPSNVGKISNGYADYTAKWQGLIRDFRSQPPPQPCIPLANAYLTFLTGYAGTISKLQVALLNKDLSAAMGAQSDSRQINAQGLQADDALGKLCASYNVPKPFSIQVDGGSSSIIGL